VHPEHIALPDVNFLLPSIKAIKANKSLVRLLFIYQQIICRSTDLFPGREQLTQKVGHFAHALGITLDIGFHQ